MQVKVFLSCYDNFLRIIIGATDKELSSMLESFIILDHKNSSKIDTIFLPDLLRLLISTLQKIPKLPRSLLIVALRSPQLLLILHIASINHTL